MWSCANVWSGLRVVGSRRVVKCRRVVGRQRVVGRRRKITKKITENSKLGETWVLKNHQSRNLALTSAKIQKRGHKRKNPKSCSKQYRGNRGKFVLCCLYSRNSCTPPVSIIPSTRCNTFLYPMRPLKSSLILFSGFIQHPKSELKKPVAQMLIQQQHRLLGRLLEIRLVFLYFKLSFLKI